MIDGIMDAKDNKTTRLFVAACNAIRREQAARFGVFNISEGRRYAHRIRVLLREKLKRTR